MAGKLSGIDAISPALTRTKNQLLAPFRLRYWLRLALVCLLTGETTGGGGGGSGANFNLPSHAPSRTGSDLFNLVPPDLGGWSGYLGWAILAVVAAIIFGIVILYISSVYRFILFDTVLTNRCELRKSWRRWQRQGTSYFWWQIGLGMLSLVTLGVIVGGPVLLAWQGGIFKKPGQHIVLLVAAGGLVLCLFIVALIFLAIVAVFTKDFVVPFMALEDKKTLDGWRALLPVLGQEKGAFALYVIMKIILAIGCAFIFGILDFFVVLGFLIPVGIIGVAVYFLAVGAGLTWNILTVALVIVAGGALVSLLFFIIAFISVPAMVFFQSYSLHFLGSRYDLLGQAMAPRETPPIPPLSSSEPIPAT
jgi:MFS family permease